MDNIITHNFKNLLKNKIFFKISEISEEIINSLIDNLFNFDNSHIDYFQFINRISEASRKIILATIAETFETIDTVFCNAPSRSEKYYINKSNVSRTITTIVGDLTFKRTYYISKANPNFRFYFVDLIFGLHKYDHYDSIIKDIAITNVFQSSQAQAARDISKYVFGFNALSSNNKNMISRQNIFNWINSWKIPDIAPSSIDTPDTLYVMADEKYIGAQDQENDIMVKCFVTFESIKQVGKNRRALVNRYVFSTTGKNAWSKFMDHIAKRYDFSKIRHIYLLADGGNWIKNGLHELKLYAQNKPQFCLCEFHFKQAINHISSDKDERKNLLEIFNTKPFEEFKKRIDELIAINPNRKETISNKFNYIKNNKSAIKRMLNLDIGSSMESHISHFIASMFASRPKGFSTKRIDNYLKLNDYFFNNINIFDLYRNSFNNKDVEKVDENIFSNNFTNYNENGNIPILSSGKSSPTYTALKELAHDFQLLLT